MPVTVKSIPKLNSNELSQIEVVCFGHFNVLHPGHLRFINFAASKGKELCIILKDDSEFTRFERTHYFPVNERAAILESVSGVNHIVTRGDRTLEQCLDIIKPKFLVLGHEFERSRPIEIEKLILKAANLDIEVIFHSGDQVSNVSFSLASQGKNLIHQSKNYDEFIRICNRRNIDLKILANNFSKFSSINTLVIGDLIVDEFIASEPVGLSSEAPVIVVKEIEKMRYVGGAGVVASHVSSLGTNCYFLSVSGDDQPRQFAIDNLKKYNVEADILIDQNRPTTYKTRYLAGNQKIFRVSRLRETDVSRELEDMLIERIDKLAPRLDNIIVSDFVYGVITNRVLDKLTAVAKEHNILLFGDLQCSSQVGNILKFQNFDMIFPTEREARIALNNKDDGIEFVAQSLFENSLCKSLVIKLGSDGLTSYTKEEDGFIGSEHFPALSVNPVDVSGAGDSILAAIATSMTANLGFMNSIAFGCLVAACSVEVVGNIPLKLQEVEQRIYEMVSNI